MNPTRKSLHDAASAALALAYRHEELAGAWLTHSTSSQWPRYGVALAIENAETARAAHLEYRHLYDEAVAS